MKAEPNDFGPDLFVKTEEPAVKASRKASPRRKAELFARITERHFEMLASVERSSSIIIFGLLMIHSVKMFHRPFELPVEYLAVKTGMGRRQQLRAVRDLGRRWNPQGCPEKALRPAVHYHIGNIESGPKGNLINPAGRTTNGFRGTRDGLRGPQILARRICGPLDLTSQFKNTTAAGISTSMPEKISLLSYLLSSWLCLERY